MLAMILSVQPQRTWRLISLPNAHLQATAFHVIAMQLMVPQPDSAASSPESVLG